MPPKKKTASAAPAGPTAQEVEETYKQMNATLESELTLLSQTLIKLRSDAAHNESLVERYTDQADTRQIEMTAVEKESSEELLRLAKLHAQVEGQLRHQEALISEAETKVDSLYDAMDVMKAEDAANTPTKAGEREKRANKGGVDARSRHSTQKKTSADLDANIVEPNGETNMNEDVSHCKEFPPPLGVSILLGRTHIDNNSNSKTNDSQTGQHSEVEAEAVDLFYARTRQLEALKKKLGALEVELAKATTLESVATDKKEGGEQRLNLNSSGGASVFRGATAGVSTLWGDTTTKKFSTCKLSDPRHLFLPSQDGRQSDVANSLISSSTLLSDDAQKERVRGLGAFEAAWGSYLDGYSTDDEEQLEGEDALDKLSGHSRTKGTCIYRGEERPELAKHDATANTLRKQLGTAYSTVKGGYTNSNPSWRQSEVHESEPPSMLLALRRQRRKQKAFFSYNNRGDPTATTTTLRPSSSPLSTFPIFLVCAPSRPPFEDLVFRNTAAPFSLDLTFSMLSSVLVKHYSADVKEIIVAPQSLFCRGSRAAQSDADVDTDLLQPSYSQQRQGSKSIAQQQQRFPTPFSTAFSLLSSANRFIDGSVTSSVCSSAAEGCGVARELLAIRDALTDYVRKCERKMIRIAEKKSSASSSIVVFDNASPAVVIILRGRVVPASSQHNEDKDGSTKGGIHVKGSEDDDLFLSFADVDDGLTAVSPITPLPTLSPTGVGVTVTSSVSQPTATLSLKAVIATVVGETASLLASSPVFGGTAASPMLPQVVLFVEAHGCTSGAGVPPLSRREPDASNDGFVMAVGPTCETLLCYKRRSSSGIERGDGGGGQGAAAAESSNVSLSGSIVASALTYILSDSKSTEVYSAERLAHAVFDQLTTSSSSLVSNNSFENDMPFALYPRSYRVPSWAEYSLPMPLKRLLRSAKEDGEERATKKPLSPLLVGSANPPLPQDEVHGSGLVARDETMMVSFFVPAQTLSASQGTADENVEGNANRSENRTSVAAEISRQRLAFQVTADILDRHHAQQGIRTPRDGNGEGYTIVAADEMLSLVNGLRYESKLRVAVDEMADEIGHFMRSAVYDTVTNTTNVNDVRGTVGGGGGGVASGGGSPMKAKRLPASVSASPSTTAFSFLGRGRHLGYTRDGEAAAEGFNDGNMTTTTVALSDVSVIYSADNPPTSPFYNNTIAKASPSSSKFAAAVRSRVVQLNDKACSIMSINGGDSKTTIDAKEDLDEPSSTLTPSQNPNVTAYSTTTTTMNTHSLLSTTIQKKKRANKDVQGKEEDEGWHSPARREPIFLLLQQRTPLASSNENESEDCKQQQHNGEEDPALAYGTLLRELQQELTHRRIESKTLPPWACYRVEVWQAHREEVIVKSTDSSSPSCYKSYKQVSVVVALWPSAYDPLETWWLKVRRDRSHAAAVSSKRQQRWDGSTSMSLRHHHHQEANSSSSSYAHGSLRAMAVTVADHATAALSPPTFVNTTASSSPLLESTSKRAHMSTIARDEKGERNLAKSEKDREDATHGGLSLPSSPSFEHHDFTAAVDDDHHYHDSASITRAVLAACKEYFDRAGAFTSAQSKGQTVEVHHTDGEEKSHANKDDDHLYHNNTNKSERDTAPASPSCSSACTFFNGQWSMTPLLAVGAIVKFTNAVDSAEKLLRPHPAHHQSNNDERGEGGIRKVRDSKAVHHRYYALSAWPLPQISSLDSPFSPIIMNSLHDVSQLRVQRRYGFAEEFGDHTYSSHSVSALTTSANSTAVANAPTVLLLRVGPATLDLHPMRSRGPIVALFIISPQNNADDDISQHGKEEAGKRGSLVGRAKQQYAAYHYALLHQQMAFKQAVATIAASTTSTHHSQFVSIVSMFSRDILPIAVCSEELSSSSSSEGGQGKSGAALRALSAMAPNAVVDYLSSRPPGGTFSCLVLFQSTNRSVPTTANSLSADHTYTNKAPPHQPPRPWVVRARRRILGNSAVLISETDGTKRDAAGASGTDRGSTKRRSQSKPHQQKDDHGSATSSAALLNENDEVVSADGVLTKVSASSSRNSVTEVGPKGADGADDGNKKKLSVIVDAPSQGSSCKPSSSSSLIVDAGDIVQGLGEYVSYELLGFGSAEERANRIGFGL